MTFDGLALAQVTFDGLAQATFAIGQTNYSRVQTTFGSVRTAFGSVPTTSGSVPTTFGSVPTNSGVVQATFGFAHFLFGTFSALTLGCSQCLPPWLAFYIMKQKKMQQKNSGRSCDLKTTAVAHHQRSVKGRAVFGDVCPGRGG